jgi:hypothetical protein
MNRTISFLLGGLVGAATVSLPRFFVHPGDGEQPVPGAALAHAEVTFGFTADAAIARVAPLFGADRERLWAPGWAPRFLRPATAADQEGMVFTVPHGHAQAVWVNTRLDLAAGNVQYVYVLPEVVATMITLRLTPLGERTRVEVTYQRTALDARANGRVLQMSAADRVAGPEWEQQINDYLRKPG